MRALERASAARHSDARRARDRRYYAANRETYAAHGRAWRLANQERFDEYQREYYQANRERINARALQWLYDNPERSREHRRLANCRRRARLRDLPTEDFTLADLEARDPDLTCYLCGEPLPVDDRHVDHLIPIAATSADLAAAGIEAHPGSTLVNAALVHGSCNKSKGRRMLPVAVERYRLNLAQLT